MTVINQLYKGQSTTFQFRELCGNFSLKSLMTHNLLVKAK